MKQNISTGLRLTLLVYAILLALYGLPHLFLPEVMGTDSAANRLVGAAALAFAFGAGWAWFDFTWDRVRIVIAMQIAWTVLFALALLWDIVIAGSDPALLPAVVLMGIFAVLFILFYFRQGRATQHLPAHG
jgi:hypothetical protein